MRLSNDFSSNDPYTTEPGSPTLTVIVGKTQLMVPYHSFRSGSFTKDAITLRFQEGTLTASGKDLDELWSELQMQSVRVLQCSQPLDEGDCIISELHWQEADEKD